MNPGDYWGTEKKVLIVDIDGTLCTDNTFPNYSTAKPYKDQIKLLHELKGQYFIVLWTARYEADKRVTEKWLNECSVPYDRLVFGKLPYHKFIEWNSYKSITQLHSDLICEQERL